MPTDTITTQEYTWELLLDNVADLTDRRLAGDTYTFYSLPDRFPDTYLHILTLVNVNITVDEARIMDQIMKESPLAKMAIMGMDFGGGQLSAVGHGAILGDWSKHEADVKEAEKAFSRDSDGMRFKSAMPFEMVYHMLYAQCTPGRGLELTGG